MKKTPFPAACLLTTVLIAVAWLPAQTKVKPGFNVFSAEQDVAIGRQSAAQVEQQLPILDDREVQNYVTRIGERLARNAQGPEFPYQFKVVNVSDINAFALPGGFMYVNRGLIEAARSEAELAGVMGHEIGHVALRHGTNQASKAYLGQAGLSMVGVLLGRGGVSNTDRIIANLGGFGLNTLFLKFSRKAETQADIVGAQMLAASGYDPMAMASFFELLHKQSGDRSGVENFFSSHPAPENRARRIEQETQALDFSGSSRPVGNFDRIKRKLERMPDAPSMADLAGQAGSGRTGPAGGGGTGPADVGRIEAPSRRLNTYRDPNGLYAVRFPSNWQTAQQQRGQGVWFVSPGGTVQDRNGQPNIIFGHTVDVFRPQRSGADLRRASDELRQSFLQGNDYLRVRRSWRRTRLDGGKALYSELKGRSPVTGEDERVELFTRQLRNGDLIYIAFILPGRLLKGYTDHMNRILESFDVRDR